MKKILTILFLLLLCITIVIAQERTVTGTVTAKEDGLPLPGVSVRVKGAPVGTQTNTNGVYKITVSGTNTILVFTYIGYTAQEVSVGTRNTIDITMSTDAKQLSEVVVTALGVRKERRALTYATQTIDPEEIVSAREPNLVNALAGKVAGVQINSSGGQAGSSARIVIRGNTSLRGNNQPLFVIDGIPIDNSNNRGVPSATEDPLFSGYGGNRAIDLDPNIIENVTVLKGASATALYGSRGAFGVIQITTKKGQRTDRKFPNISFSSSIGLDDTYTDGYQSTYLQGLNGLYRNGLPLELGGFQEGGGTAPQTSGSWGPHKDQVSQAVIDAIGMPQVIDPREQFYKTGRTWNNSISLSGGGEKSTYLLSYSNLDQEGTVEGNKFIRNSLLGSFTTQLSQKVRSSTSVNYISSKTTRYTEGNGSRSYLFALNFQPISFDAKRIYEQYGNLAWTANNNFTTGFNNPYWLIHNNSLPSLVDRFIVSNETSVEILPWLKLTNRIGLDTYTDEQKERVNVNTISVPLGRMYEAVIKRTQINNDLILSANKDFGDWNISGFIGNNINDRRYASRTIRGENLSVPGFYDITGALSTTPFQFDEKRRLVGIYASASADYKNFLFLNATARNDWSSTLPTGDNSFFYPSVSLGFVFTDVLDIDEKYLPYGKIRISVAQAGNDADPYLTKGTYTQANPSDGTRGNINFPFRSQNGFLASNVAPNNQLKPEIVTEFEVGTELRFLSNRLGLDFSYYNKKSRDQIIQQEISSASGFVERVINAGSLSNRGIELIVTANPVKLKDFNWDMQLNYGRNKFKLNSLAEGVDNIFLAGFENPQIRIDKNYGYGVIWGLGFKRNEQGQMLIDDDGYPVIADDLGPIGNATPKWTGGWRNTFTYKGLSLSALFDVREGGDILNMDLFYSSFYGTAKVTEQRNTEIIYEGIRESDNQPNTTPVMRDQNYWRNFFSSYDENFIEDGSFIKLREITLGYTLPSGLLQKTPFQSLGISVTGRNLWIKSDFSFKDPEGNLLGDSNAQGFYHAVTPGTKSITFGLNAKF